MDHYVGLYDLNGADLSITRENDYLFLQLAGQPKFQLFARTVSEFFLKEVNADIIFIENEVGEVEKVVLKQAGMKHDAPRKKGE